MILAIEGLDGSGKTTVGSIVASELGARFLTGIPPEMGAPGDAFMREYDSGARYFYYLSAALWTASRFSTAAELVVVDRYLASAHALHVAAPEDSKRAARRVKVPRADMCVFLHAPEVERCQRLASRSNGEDPFEERLRTDAGFRQQVSLEMLAYPGIRTIPTANRTPVDVALDVVGLWNGVVHARRP